MRGEFGADVAARARTIVDDDGLAEPRSQPLLHFADDEIAAAAGCKRYDETDRPRRIADSTLSGRINAETGEAGSDEYLLKAVHKRGGNIPCTSRLLFA